MSDDNAIIVDDGSLIEIDALDQIVFKFDWGTKHLDSGVTIATSSMKIVGLRPAPLAVTSITRSVTTATVTTTAAHGLSTGDYITIAGAGQSQYNITAAVTVVSASVFTITVANAGASPATGTITYAPGLGKDSADILSAAPYSSRWTVLRLLSGGAAALDYLFEVGNTIVTDETPAQTKDRSFRVRIVNK